MDDIVADFGAEEDNWASDDDVSFVRDGEGMDWDALEIWLKDNISGLSGSLRVAQFHGGHANLTYCVGFDDKELVVRRPPLGTVAPGAHDMAREFKVLTGLAPHFDQAPKAYAFCSDPSVIGSEFIVVERCHGAIVREAIPSQFEPSKTLERDLSFALVDAMLGLQAVNVHEVGFGNRDRAKQFVERQVEGWNKRWELSAGDTLKREFGEAYDLLRSNMPKTQSISVVHNDLKLDNCMFDPANPQNVKFILDWDMATLGDPLVEFGTLLGYWRQRGDDFNRAPTVDLDMSNFPSRADMIERYRAGGGQVDHIGWYEAFALWKHAVVLQQLFQRFDRGESKDQRYADFPKHIPQLIQGAAQMLQRAT